MKRRPQLSSRIETTSRDENRGFFGRLIDSLNSGSCFGQLLSCLLDVVLDLLL